MKRRSAITKATPVAEAKPRKSTPTSKVDQRLGGVSRKDRVLQQSPKTRATELLRQTQVLQYTLNGYSVPMIAHEMKTDSTLVLRYLSRALDDLLCDRDELVQRHLAIAMAEYAQFRRTWAPRAHGGIRPDGTRVEPDPEAARLILRAMRDRNQLIDHGRTLRVEHTGAAGGPIMTASLDLVAAAEIARQTFSGGVAPHVILAEGQAIPEDDGRRH